jgi:hypothetical protein
MGFWGTFVVHRHERPLAELLPEVAALTDAEPCAGFSGEWQVTRLFAGSGDLPTGFLTDLRDVTRAPVLAADVLDSDAALVRAVGRRTPSWEAWLQLDRAIGHLALPPAPFDENGNHLGDDWTDPAYEREAEELQERVLGETLHGSAAAAAAVAWAREAGVHPGTVQDVAAAFDSHDTFVEDVFFDLLGRLGIAPEPDVAAPRPGLADVLRGLLGHRLRAVELTPHQPARRERLAFAGMPDVRWHFEGRPAVTACGCGGAFVFVPSAAPDDSATTVDFALPADVVGHELADAATVRYRNFPDIRGAVLRFGDHGLFVTASDGTWTITAASATDPAAEITDRHGHELRFNGWLPGRAAG